MTLTTPTPPATTKRGSFVLSSRVQAQTQSSSSTLKLVLFAHEGSAYVHFRQEKLKGLLSHPFYEVLPRWPKSQSS